MAFGNEPEEVLTLQAVWVEAEQAAVGRAGIDDPKVAVHDEDAVCRGVDPGVQDIKPEGVRVSSWSRGVQGVARGSPALIRRLLHQTAQSVCSEADQSGPAGVAHGSSQPSC